MDFKKIKEYKGIDEGLIRRIANISETEIPPSELTALKMNDYINEQKAILIFNTMDKKAYKRDLERAFNAQTVEQFIAYKTADVECSSAGFINIFSYPPRNASFHFLFRFSLPRFQHPCSGIRPTPCRK